MAKFSNITRSSPKTICTKVAKIREMIVPTVTPAANVKPQLLNKEPNGSCARGSATYPTRRPVTVIPSCVLESMNEVRRVTFNVRAASLSPHLCRFEVLTNSLTHIRTLMRRSVCSPLITSQRKGSRKVKYFLVPVFRTTPYAFYYAV